MRNFKLIMAMVILVCSVLLLFIRLFTPQTIQITLETGREITTENPEYYNLMQVILLVASAFLIGATSTYLYYNSDVKKGILSRSGNRAKHASVARLLKGDEKRVFLAVVDSKEDVLQNRLVEKLGISKVKVTRILSRLESKGLVTRQRHGLTNKVKLVEITQEET